MDGCEQLMCPDNFYNNHQLTVKTYYWTIMLQMDPVENYSIGHDSDIRKKTALEHFFHTPMPTYRSNFKL